MITVESPRGKSVTIHDREGTCDLSITGGTFRLWGKLDDEYGLADLHPRTFLDIGGHIGVVTLAVLVDNPDCEAVILEPLPENLAAIAENLTTNGVVDRVTVFRGAVGPRESQRIGYRLPRVIDAPETDQYVGGSVEDDFAGASVDVPTVTLAYLLRFLGPDTVDLMKVDCEGCEYTLFEQPGLERVRMIVGEYHPGGNLKALEKTHDVTLMPHAGGGTGNFRAVLR